MLKPKQWLLHTAILSAMAGSIAGAQSNFTTVGNPNDNSGADLSAAIMAAYNSGAAGVTINPGTYTLTQATFGDPYNPGVLYLSGLSRPFVIAGYNVKLVMSANYPGINCLYSAGLTIKGLTMDRGKAYGNQGVIQALGSDSNGRYLDVQNDAGYPTSANNYGYCTDLVGSTHVPRVGCPDLVGGGVTDLGNNRVRVRITDVGSWGDVTAQVGDYLVSPAGGPALLGLLFCNNFTIQDVTFLSSPGESTITEYRGTGNHYLNDKITYGPPPPGATVAPLRSITSGLQAADDYVGPDVENCYFEGVGDDAYDLRGDYVTVYSVSGSTVTVDNSFLWEAVTSTHTEPIRLSNQAGQYLDTAVSKRVTQTQTVLDANGNPKTIQVDVLTLTATPPSNFAQATPLASNPNMDCPRAKFINDTVRDSRAHGVIARGDYDLIQDCTFINTLLPGLLISVQGGSWQEGDYPHNVTVKNNVFINNPGMIIGSVGARGNANISITGNVFANTVGAYDNPSILAQGVVGLTITNNTFANLGQQSSAGGTHANSAHAVNLQNCSQVTLGNNLLTNPGASLASPVYVVDATSQQSITGMNAASFTNKIYPNEYLTLTNAAAGLNLDDPNYSQKAGTLLQLYPANGVSAQNWQVNWQADGSCTLGNQASNGLVLDDFGGGGAGTNQGLWTATRGTNQEWWFVPSTSSAYLIKSVWAGLYLDVPSTSQGSPVCLNPSSGAATQNWQTTLAPASAGYGQPGTTLTQGQYLVSPHGTCYLTQQTDGNLVLYSGSGPSNKGYYIGGTGYYNPTPGNYFTIMQTDGNLVTYAGTPSARGPAVFASGTYGNNGAYLAVTDDGHFQVLSTTGAVLWQRP